MANEKLHEECAVVGVSLNKCEAAGVIYNGLLALQHRGQEGSGIAVVDGTNISVRKGLGLLTEVFDGSSLSEMPAVHVGIGHNRYSTTGSNAACNCQPFVTEFLTGRIATAHNGNIVNADELKTMLLSYGVNFAASSDTEVISSLLAFKIIKSKNPQMTQGIIEAIKLIKGAFSLVVTTSNNQLIAIRDAHGFRPLCIGANKHGAMVASESCALDSCGFKFVRDVAPGEIVVIEKGQIVYNEVVLPQTPTALCVFEHVYFARPDSVIDGQSVITARYNMGMQLAKEFPVNADIVAGVPDSGVDAAIGYAQASGIPYVSVFVKNRYIGRSFIYPSQVQRESAVKLKLNPLRANIEGKRIVIVDDSIVRGTTSAKMVKMLLDSGAKEVHMRVSSPMFKHRCYFGTDVDDPSKLIANQMTTEEIATKIGVNSLGFISIEGLISSCDKSKLEFCTGCFSGQYKIDVNGSNKNTLEEK